MCQSGQVQKWADCPKERSAEKFRHTHSCEGVQTLFSEGAVISLSPFAGKTTSLLGHTVCSIFTNCFTEKCVEDAPVKDDKDRMDQNGSNQSIVPL